MLIHQIRTPLANSYIVEYPEQLLVFDVGARCQEWVLGFLEKVLGRQRHEVSLIVCTHDDPDHLGGVRALASVCDSPFALPYASRSPLRKHVNEPAGFLVRMGTSMVEFSRPRSWKMYGSPERRARVRERARSAVEIDPKSLLGLGPSYRLMHEDPLPLFDDWTVVHTPGHTWDSCCYYHSSTSSLISGDTLLGSSNKERLVLPSVFSSRRNLRSSVATLKALKPKHVFPGHGSEFHGEGLLNSV